MLEEAFEKQLKEVENMAKQVTQFELLISCPSDVKEELEIIKETVEIFNRMYGAVNNASIVTKHWLKDSYPELGDHPQKILNKQFVLDCDAAVAVFWTRFGTPTDEYGSGTEEEIEELIKSGKQVFLYFSDCLAHPSSMDHEQYQKVLAFRKKYKDKGIYGTYSDLDDFRKDFLNHLSLYFVKIFADSDTSIVPTNSKLSINGVVNGKVADQPVIIRRDYLNSEFFRRKKDTIAEIYEQINSIKIPIKKIEPKIDAVEGTTPLSEELTSKINNIALSLQDQLKGIGELFSSSEVVINDEFKKTINAYATENNINVNENEFYDIGDLKKIQQPFGGGSFGINPSYSLVGSDEGKTKYKLIKQLHWKIDGYQQYYEYFTAMKDKLCLEFALSNFGTKFDEDIDVKIYVKKETLCVKDQLPVPSDDILEIISKSFNKIYRSNKTVNVEEYCDYPVIFTAPYIPTSVLGGPSHEEEVKRNRREYNNNLNTTFCYDYFQEGDYDILRYNQKYIKQNTSVFFPSILIFNYMPDKILYEISSKHYPDIIKDELLVLKEI